MFCALTLPFYFLIFSGAFLRWFHLSLHTISIWILGFLTTEAYQLHLTVKVWNLKACVNMLLLQEIRKAQRCSNYFTLKAETKSISRATNLGYWPNRSFCRSNCPRVNCLSMSTRLHGFNYLFLQHHLRLKLTQFSCGQNSWLLQETWQYVNVHICMYVYVYIYI